VPADVFGGFLRVLAARADEMALLRLREPAPPGEWDPHPPLAERVAALVALTDEGPEQAERPAAGDLVPDLPGLGRALQAVAFPPAGRTTLSWEEFFDAARMAEMEREADASLRAISRVAGAPVTGPADVLDLAADGRLRKIAETVFDARPPEEPTAAATSAGEARAAQPPAGEAWAAQPPAGEAWAAQPPVAATPAEETTARVTDLIALLLALAALRGGVARWRHSWTGTAELVAIDGSHLDVVGPAELAADPATVGEARERLAARGIDLAAAAPSAGGRPTARVPVIGGVVNVLVDGVRTDLLVVETGLVLMPGLPRSRAGEAKRRLNQLATEGILADGRAARPGADRAPATPEGPGESRFVPFTDVAGASASRNGRRSWQMNLRDGGTLSVRTALDSDELPGGWTALDDAVSFLTSTR
jgi:hypothetical protein